MYARIIPFPVDTIDDEVRCRLDFQRMRLQAQVLDQELDRLARGNFRSPGEWARQAATPIVRTKCIRRYLIQATAIRIAATPDERRRRHISDARDEFKSALSATATSLVRLSAPAVESAERHELLKQLSLYQMQQKRVLQSLDDLFEKCRRTGDRRS